MAKNEKKAPNPKNYLVGRNGPDQLSRFCIILALIALFISFFAWSAVGQISAVALMSYSYFRIASKNISRRIKENNWYVEHIEEPLVYPFHGITKKLGTSKYTIFHCPNCHQGLRVPKGKGHISMVCPKCGTKFDGIA